MFECVIFDWDGTLADTMQVIVISFKKALDEINCNVSDEYIERRIGIGAAETFKDILRSTEIKFDDGLIEQLVEKKNKFEIELGKSVKLFEGAKELLESLHGKIKMALASMNNREVINYLLKVNDLSKFFSVVLTAESVSKSKPDPEIFLKTASELGCNPERCVVVEDSVFGVKAAKTANMGCIAVLTGVYSRLELEKEKPDLIVQTLKDRQIIDFIMH